MLLFVTTFFVSQRKKTLYMLIKQRAHPFPETWLSGLASSVLNKGKSAIPPLFSSLEVLPSASDQAKLLAENFSKNSNLDDSGIYLPILRSRTNLKLHNFSVTPKMV